MGLRTGGRRAKSLKNRVKSSKIELRFREIRSEGCTSCTPVQQALILPILRFYGSASAEPFLFVRCFSCWTGGHDCAGLSVAPKGRDRRAFQIVAQASRGRRGRPSDAPQFSKCNSDDRRQRRKQEGAVGAAASRI